MSLMLLYI